MDKDGNKVGESSVTAARWGISQVVHLQAILRPETYYLSLKIRKFQQVTLSRIGMAAPGMLLNPILMNALEKRGLLAKYPRLLAPAPFQTALCGLFLTFTCPLMCALFEQESPIQVSSLETDVRQRLLAKGFQHDDILYYNKGL